MITSRNGQHVGNEFGRNGRARLVLLVHTGIRKTGNNGSDATRRGSFTGRDEDEKFHQVVIDVAAARLDDEYVFFSNGFSYFDVDLIVREFLGSAWSERYSKAVDGELAARGLHGKVQLTARPRIGRAQGGCCLNVVSVAYREHNLNETCPQVV